MKKRKTILWAAVIAALFLVVGMSVWHFCGEDIISFETPEQTTLTSSTAPTASPVSYIRIPSSEPTDDADITPTPSETPVSVDTSTPKPLATSKPKPQQLCTLTILGKQIKVMDNVDESTLKKTPGWMPSSALPGEDGMCVIYGHRNRRHLRVLENIKTGDEITITMTDGTVFTYTVSETKIFESTSDMTLPMADGKALVLVTCFPFRYSGHAPGKFVLNAKYQQYMHSSYASYK